jgi:crossover junction endodeoxyribonuclease RusA
VTDLVVDKVTAGMIRVGIETSWRLRLSLPYPRPPAGLTGNTRVNRWAKAKDTRMVRGDVLVIARGAGLHLIPDGMVGHVTAGLVWAPGDRRARDEDNLWPLAKVGFDALARGRRDWVGLDLVPNDSPAYMTKLAPRIEPPPAKGMWLDITLHPAPALTGEPQQ